MENELKRGKGTVWLSGLLDFSKDDSELQGKISMSRLWVQV